MSLKVLILLTPRHVAWTYRIEPAQRQGDMRGFDRSVKGSWQIRHMEREMVELEGEMVEGEMPIID